MGRRQSIKASQWRKYLEYQGLTFDRTSGDHKIWKRPGLTRPVVFRRGPKEIPEFHVRTCLKTLGVTFEDFEAWLDHN